MDFVVTKAEWLVTFHFKISLVFRAGCS
jgi:hypothetical protein